MIGNSEFPFKVSDNTNELIISINLPNIFPSNFSKIKGFRNYLIHIYIYIY